MGRQMELGFVDAEPARIVEAFDEATIRKIIELMARILVAVHEQKRKEEER